MGGGTTLIFVSEIASVLRATMEVAKNAHLKIR